MDIWKFLQIEPTKDKRLIKKAYTKLLRKYHPEEDPTGFQKLRRCYEIAISLSDYPDEDYDPETEENSNKNQNELASTHLDTRESTSTAETVEKEQDNHTTNNPSHSDLELAHIDEEKTIHNFMKHVEILFATNLHSSIPHWKQFLDNEALWNFSIKNKLSYALLLFLSQGKYKDLNQETLLFLNTFFDWTSQELSLTNHYSHDAIKSFFEHIHAIRDQKPAKTQYIIKIPTFVKVIAILFFIVIFSVNIIDWLTELQ